jgi:NAD-dependent deacetylase
VTFVLPAGACEALRQAKSVAVLTGAGTSAESGVPTFRDALTGLWAQYDPQELATPEAFRRNPKLVWEWYAWRKSLCEEAEPNAGHHALVELARKVSRFELLTQNVDGLHQRAGSTDVVELHGNLTRIRCSETGTACTAWDPAEIPPRHPETGGLLRPDVVWFGEGLPPEALERGFRAAQLFDVFLCVGASTVVYPAAQLPFEALRSGKIVIEVNPSDTPLTAMATFAIEGPSAEVLPELVARAWPG